MLQKCYKMLQMLQPTYEDDVTTNFDTFGA